MEQLTVSINKRQQEASGIVSLELVDPYGRDLPPFTAGAHIDVQVAPGVVRQYSLFNAPAERHRYCIAVLNQHDGRGGSRLVHETLHEGDAVAISAPRNAFPLVEAGGHAVLVAGGIGVTPILSMAQRLAALDRSFELHYCARSRTCAAFIDRLAQGEFGDRVHFHFDDEPHAPRFDIDALLHASQAPDAHLYVCGPGGFMDRVVDAASACWPEHAVHLERFSPRVLQAASAAATERAFRVVLARSGATLDVPADQTILGVLQQHGVAVPVSCEQGVCGTCLVDVLDGEPDHRDSYLTDTERRANQQITVCCSRSRSAVLTLDL
jgi:vanillate monooxygenase ferredoxin subunit